MGRWTSAEPTVVCARVGEGPAAHQMVRIAPQRPAARQRPGCIFPCSYGGAHYSYADAQVDARAVQTLAGVRFQFPGARTPTTVYGTASMNLRTLEMVSKPTERNKRCRKM